MTEPALIQFVRPSAEQMLHDEMSVALFAEPGGKLFASAAPFERACAAVARAAASEAFGKLKTGDALSLEFPEGVKARRLLIVKLGRAATAAEVRRAGGSIARHASPVGARVLCRGIRRIEDLALGTALRAYRFNRHKTSGSDSGDAPVFDFCVSRPEQAEARYASAAASAAGVSFARDLVNEPANILNTLEFADRLARLEDDGIAVTILDEDDLEAIGMRSLLAVGRGSQSPSRVAVLEWRGGEGAPLVFAGKGVVFDTGGISLKPAARMERMTMDMAGAAAVAGALKAAARRRARANVIGLVGLVENMPGGGAQRPGDVIRSLKGDTIEVINTDAEGRLVLADLLWHAQTEYSPCGIVDLATLTGAIVVGLGAEFAGAFSNCGRFWAEFHAASRAAGEGAWRLPLDDAYDRLLKSRVADMKNVGGRDAGAITAAQFLQRFVKPETPWIHLDIAGVAFRDSASAFAPAGATGWGVLTLDQLIRSKLESE